MKENKWWLFFPSLSVWNTDQAPALSAQAGVLEPSPHVFVGTDDQWSDHQDPLPVLDDTLTTLFENKEMEGRRSTQVKRITRLFDLLQEGNLVKLEPMSPSVGCRPLKEGQKKKGPQGFLPLLPAFRVVHVSPASRAVEGRPYESTIVLLIKLKRWRRRQEMQSKKMQKTQEEFNL